MSKLCLAPSSSKLLLFIASHLHLEARMCDQTSQDCLALHTWFHGYGQLAKEGGQLAKFLQGAGL